MPNRDIELQAHDALGARWRDLLAGMIGCSRRDLVNRLADKSAPPVEILQVLNGLKDRQGLVHTSELRDYALYVYGNNWRDRLAEVLPMKRGLLLATLASDQPLSRDFAHRILTLVAERLAQQQAEVEAMRSRISQLLA